MSILESILIFSFFLFHLHQQMKIYSEENFFVFSSFLRGSWIFKIPATWVEIDFFVPLARKKKNEKVLSISSFYLNFCCNFCWPQKEKQNEKSSQIFFFLSPESIFVSWKKKKWKVKRKKCMTVRKFSL